MNTYCVKCKKKQKKTENIDPKMFRTKNNRFHYDDYDDYDDYYEYYDLIFMIIMIILNKYLHHQNLCVCVCVCVCVCM